MEVLCFKVKGKLAHFKKYYANNTAFSFTIPPRTSLMGMVAAVMGWPRDTYYESLSSRHILFGVRVLSPLKKTFHRLNFLSIKSTGDISKNLSSDFRGYGGRIQTPFEIVSGFSLAKDEVVYQIFLSHTEAGKEVFENVKQQFLQEEPVYNLSLGVANFHASLFDVELILPDKVTAQKSDDFILMHSAVPTHQVESLRFDKEEYDQYNFVEEDLLPGEFITNYSREVEVMNRLLFSTTHLPLRVKVNTTFWQITTDTELLNIQFMDQ